jgi:hypothetical protein
MKPLTPATLILAAFLAAAAADVPHRKPGLWEMTLHSSTTKGSEISRRICLDRESEDLLNRQGVASVQEACSKVEMRSTGSQLIAKAVCNMGGVKMTSEATTTFSGDTASTTKVHTTFDPPLAGRSQSDSQDEAKWLGACPADMKPGDMIMKTGGSHPHEMRTNLHEMFKPRP